MVDKLVNDRIPKSSAEYIIRKAGQSSLLGLAQTLGRSPLAEEIESRSEAAYHPSTLEKVPEMYWALQQMPLCWEVPDRGLRLPDS